MWNGAAPVAAARSLWCQPRLPPQLVHVSVRRRRSRHAGCPRRRRHTRSRSRNRAAGAPRGNRQVAPVPAGCVGPELEDVPVLGSHEHVRGALVLERIAGRRGIRRTRRRAGRAPSGPGRASRCRSCSTRGCDRRARGRRRAGCRRSTSRIRMAARGSEAHAPRWSGRWRSSRHPRVPELVDVTVEPQALVHHMLRTRSPPGCSRSQWSRLLRLPAS